MNFQLLLVYTKSAKFLYFWVPISSSPWVQKLTKYWKDRKTKIIWRSVYVNCTCQKKNFLGIFLWGLTFLNFIRPKMENETNTQELFNTNLFWPRIGIIGNLSFLWIEIAFLPFLAILPIFSHLELTKNKNMSFWDLLWSILRNYNQYISFLSLFFSCQTFKYPLSNKKVLCEVCASGGSAVQQQ